MLFQEIERNKGEIQQRGPNDRSNVKKRIKTIEEEQEKLTKNCKGSVMAQTGIFRTTGRINGRARKR